MIIDFQSEYGKLLHDDMPHQYQNREKTAFLLDAIGKQLDDVKAFLCSVMIHRTLSTTSGIQLDYIGSIVAMTRAEAKRMFNRTGDLSDAFYRRALYYKIMLNFSSSTYGDILKYLRLYFSRVGEESDFVPRNDRDILGFHITEEVQHPAAIIVESGDGTSDDNPLPTSQEINAMVETKIPRGGGIGIRYRIWTAEDFNTYFKMLTKNLIDIECAVEPFGSWNENNASHIWLVDENGNILADADGDLYVYEHKHLVHDYYANEASNILTADKSEQERDVIIGDEHLVEI